MPVDLQFDFLQETRWGCLGHSIAMPPCAGVAMKTRRMDIATFGKQDWQFGEMLLEKSAARTCSIRRAAWSSRLKSKTAPKII